MVNKNISIVLTTVLIAGTTLLLKYLSEQFDVELLDTLSNLTVYGMVGIASFDIARATQKTPLRKSRK